MTKAGRANNVYQLTFSCDHLILYINARKLCP